MILGIAIMVAAFYWLMYETEWLTVRLPFGKLYVIEVNVNQLVAIAFCVVIGTKILQYLIEDMKTHLEELNAHTS